MKLKKEFTLLVQNLQHQQHLKETAFTSSISKCLYVARTIERRIDRDKDSRAATFGATFFYMPMYLAFLILVDAAEMITLFLPLWLFFLGIALAEMNKLGRKNFRFYFRTVRLRFRNLLRRYLKYAQAIGNEEMVSLKDLSKKTRVSVRRIRKDLAALKREQMIDFALPAVREDMLFLTEQARQLRENELRLLEEKQRMEKEYVNRSLIRNFAERIRLYNDILPDREVSRALDDTERLLKRIDADLEKYPHYDSRLRRTVSYYLPQIESLLGTYRELYETKRDLSGSKETRSDIIRGIRMLNDALRHILEGIVQDISMRVQTDISVMQTMLAQDGVLTD